MGRWVSGAEEVGQLREGKPQLQQGKFQVRILEVGGSLATTEAMESILL